jgi:hypothetical protein
MLDDAIAGFVAGIVGTLLGYPLDTIKVYQQAEAVRRGPRPSIAQAARAIRSTRGLAGFYAGVLAPLVGVTALNTLGFTLYARFRALLGLPRRAPDLPAGPSPTPFDARVLLAGAMIGPCATLISTPMDLVKIQMQQSNQRVTLDALRAIVGAGGARALYVGVRVNLARECAFGVGYFGAYELARERALAGVVPSAIAVPLAGAVGGVAGWALSLPLDTIKSVQQAGPVARGAVRQPIAVFRQIYVAHGVSGFWRGAGVSILRAMLVSGTRFSVYEAMLGSLKERRRVRRERARPVTRS